MRIIKRYANRKLYDTGEKRYVNLTEVSALVRKGIEVKVVDSRSGDDITRVTLSQILLEKQKKGRGGLPKHLFNDLIRTGGPIVDAVKKSVESGLGVIKNLEAEIDRGISKLIKRGRMTEKEARRFRKDLIARLTQHKEELERRVEEQVGRVLTGLNIPTRKDVQKLTRRIEELAEKIDDIAEARAPAAPKKAPAKKSTRKASAKKPARGKPAPKNVEAKKTPARKAAPKKSPAKKPAKKPSTEKKAPSKSSRSSK